ncbi:MAG: isochorismatase family protein [Candidatus Omnitrophica bacterium]|nr:isochorismatase family protein [Candidatus Omnitrophota bacterium]MDD5670599.1 isochorismatase family protein [Candidatus Omnitrophota bacterium]
MDQAQNPVYVSKSDGLILVDLQNDFFPPNGALAVQGGDEIIEPINRIMPMFFLIAATQDWHPRDHRSFRTQGGPWPVHCVQNTWGAKLHSALQAEKIHIRALTGQTPEAEGYSGFERTSLKDDLVKGNIKRVFITGLATDYCVKHTALDALKYGFKTIVIEDLIRAVNVHTGDGERALAEIEGRGGEIVRSSQIRRE